VLSRIHEYLKIGKQVIKQLLELEESIEDCMCPNFKLIKLTIEKTKKDSECMKTWELNQLKFPATLEGILSGRDCHVLGG
jgi:hypothetical protein